MSRRNTTDPLLRAFLDACKLNLLAIPREGARVGDVYVDTSQGVSAPGQLEYLLTPKFKMPPIKTGERLTEVAAKQTRAIQLKAGLSLLQGFFTAMGAESAVGQIKAEYERKRTRDKRDHGFESFFLQGRVRCEPYFLSRGAAEDR